MRPTEIQASSYSEQLQNKTTFIKDNFAQHPMPELEIFASEPLHYRLRAEFRLWHDGDELHHIMFDQATKQKYQVHHFPPACILINEVMVDLILLLKNNEPARRKLFQVDYLATISGEIIVSLLYHKALDEQWVDVMQEIRSTLRKKYYLALEEERSETREQRKRSMNNLKLEINRF